ncbi:hypothetical protein ORI20_10950 [Mycobacterium sp. CVI_P3]|uniref:Uncharacterized protein n=1 Tax=Mycobacterium pinniadriaticum TaxID=2994102 RepID=A0ABT3SEC9_9MYCO|nr:hypothetical protein [Mycobacterium pinniadriaticum]MCX2930798.1 hypothetical protein [Mycobacterium pinniadriaticum]MCX2937222.1 hypothetical protein [Mycobacterium pinniadriaticum]
MFDIDERDRQREVARSRQRTTRLARYQLDVVGTHAADVVGSAGGWLFDRVMAGWDVRVAVTEPGDGAALQILGVQAVSLAAVFDRNVQAPAALAVAGAACSADDRVRDALAASVRSARTEVTMWGEVWVPTLGRPGDEVRHELSAAARVFKAQARFAAGLDPAVTAFEVFHSYGQHIATEYPDLLPVG